MNATWKTKWGVRRVRHDVPTIEEALIAAENLATDQAQRVEIAASLMGVSVAEAQEAAAKHAARTRGRVSLVAGRTRAVVVEYKRPRGPVRPIVSVLRKR
jgi:predicted nucleic acid-binding protein